MKSLHKFGTVKAVLLASVASTFALAGPAMAQDDGSAGDTLASVTQDEAPPIVVTGSRIRRQDYNANGDRR